MITDEYTDYVIVIVELENKEEIDRLPGKLKIVIDKRDIPSREYLIAVLHNFLDTGYLRESWIRDDIYRFLGFLYRETQISRIVERVKRIEEPVAIIILEKGDEGELENYRDRMITLRSSFEGIDDLAIFRLDLEKERGKNLKVQ